MKIVRRFRIADQTEQAARAQSQRYLDANSPALCCDSRQTRELALDGLDPLQRNAVTRWVLGCLICGVLGLHDFA